MSQVFLGYQERGRGVLNEQVKTKEDEIIVRIARRPDVTQRQLASETGISLGLTNIILKRLAHKGYLKMKRLNRRNIEYILTPDGFARYSLRSYNYVLRTISSMHGLRQKIKDIVKEKAEQGAAGFVILEDGDLADIAELVLRELASETGIQWVRGEGPEGWVRLVCDIQENGEGQEGPAGAETALGSGDLNLCHAIAEAGL